MPYLGAFPSEAVRARLRALSPSEPYGPTRALRSPQKASDSPRARPQRKPAGRGDTPHTGRPDRLPRYPVSGINRRRAPHRSHRPHPQTGRRDPARSQRKPRRAQGPQGRPQHAPHAGAARVDLRPLAGPHGPKRAPRPPESTRAESSTRQYAPRAQCPQTRRGPCTPSERRPAPHRARWHRPQAPHRARPIHPASARASGPESRDSASANHRRAHTGASSRADQSRQASSRHHRSSSSGSTPESTAQHHAGREERAGALTPARRDSLT
jgi:hypothetical protein